MRREQVGNVRPAGHGGEVVRDEVQFSEHGSAGD
jgi:hypothetical protein